MGSKLLLATQGSADDAAWRVLNGLIDEPSSQTPAWRRECMPLDLVSSLFLFWLADLSEDYCRGQRGSQISAIRDVLGCSKRAACLLLMQGNWDIESALRCYYAKG